ncbi:MAG TPA: vitamin K epoxide reductase family protein [Vicinamibacterales bacterium]|nr:vitamin K epoxide reductase family protein [Vicinamibacterales bacterium]
MGRKATAKRSPRVAEKAPSYLTTPTPYWPLLALSIIGVLLTAYLSWTSFSGGSLQGCSEGSACDMVLSSRWATLLGLPTAFWGLLTYLALAGISFIARADRRWRLAWTIAFFGVLYSVYLTTVSLTILHAACPYCLTSLTLMTVIFGLVTLQRPEPLPGFSWQGWLRVRTPVAVAIIAFLHLNYIGVVGKPPAAEDPVLRQLATHLAQTGAKMYGAEWCPHCQDQKALFGAAAKRLPYIECSIGAQGTGQTTVCRNAGITTYPTWEIGGQRYQEVMSTLRLAELSGFDLAAATKAATTQQSQ